MVEAIFGGIEMRCFWFWLRNSGWGASHDARVGVHTVWNKGNKCKLEWMSTWNSYFSVC